MVNFIVYVKKIFDTKTVKLYYMSKLKKNYVMNTSLQSAISEENNKNMKSA